jgi:soluble lytic murein transglycosylase-like protein
MENLKKYFAWSLALVVVLALSACSTPPKGAEARVYARVKEWRSSLHLHNLERSYDLPTGLLAAVMHQESGGKANARSTVGAEGLFQIMPATARDLKLASAYSPQPAAQAAAQYLAQLYKRYRGDLKLALAAYNWGMGNVDRHMNNGGSFGGMPAETRNYITRVTQLRQRYN